MRKRARGVHAPLTVVLYVAAALVGTSCTEHHPVEIHHAPVRAFSAANGRALVWADFGGLHNEAAAQTFLEQWAELAGGNYASDIVDDARLLSGGKVPWDIANSNPFVIDLGCKPGGWARPLDPAIVQTQGYPAQFVSRCWIAPWLYGGVLAYNPRLVPRPPTSWADFFDLQHFPGGRGALDYSGFSQQFEIGTLALGVPVDQVYVRLNGSTQAEGRRAMQAALTKWESIREELVFQSYGSEQLAQLDRGEVVMAMVSTPRAVASIRQGANIAIAWDTSIVGLSTFMVPTSSSNPQLAMELLNWMLDPAKQVEFARASFYGPTNPEAQRRIAADPDLCAVIVSCGRRLQPNTLVIDDAWYGERGELIVQLWSAWKQGTVR
jgi:putative spermidine/putrescine transport system substrate-binding protein